MITYTRASQDEELYQILAIQKNNLKEHLTEEEMKESGYITVPHTFDILKKMNTSCSHILAKNDEEVVGYALVMLQSFRNEMPILTPMFKKADELLNGKNYVVMGQICIAKPYRKQGVFRGMCQYYQKALSHKYDCLFTEVACENYLSMAAHKKIGFMVLETQITEGTKWALVNWNWNK